MTIIEHYTSNYEHCNAEVTLQYDEPASGVERGENVSFPCPECGRDHRFGLEDREDDTSPSDYFSDDSEEGDEPERKAVHTADDDPEETAEDDPGAEPEAEPEEAPEADEVLAELDDLFEADAVEEGPLPFNPEAHTVPEIRELVQDVDDVPALEALANVEREQENRTTAVDAIEARAAKLRGQADENEA